MDQFIPLVLAEKLHVFFQSVRIRLVFCSLIIMYKKKYILFAVRGQYKPGEEERDKNNIVAFKNGFLESVSYANQFKKKEINHVIRSNI